jgi:hypothetical protein
MIGGYFMAGNHDIRKQARIANNKRRLEAELRRKDLIVEAEIAREDARVKAEIDRENKKAQSKILRQEAKVNAKLNKYKRKSEHVSLKDQIKKIQFGTFTKAMVALIIISALLDLQLSYVLAFLDRIQIAEDLSKQVCITILGTAFVYMIRAYFDSKAEYGNNNTLKDSPNKFDKLKESINKIADIKSIENLNNSELDSGIIEDAIANMDIKPNAEVIAATESIDEPILNSNDSAVAVG